MGYKKLGLAFCGGLRHEAKIVNDILEEQEFEVALVVCKSGKTPKEFLNINEAQKVRPGYFESMCTKSKHYKRLNIFGWVDPVSGKHGMVQQEKGNTDGFLAMLKKNLHRYKDIIIDLFVDQARWHKG